MRTLLFQFFLALGIASFTPIVARMIYAQFLRFKIWMNRKTDPRYRKVSWSERFTRSRGDDIMVFMMFQHSSRRTIKIFEQLLGVTTISMAGMWMSLAEITIGGTLASLLFVVVGIALIFSKPSTFEQNDSANYCDDCDYERKEQNKLTTHHTECKFAGYNFQETWNEKLQLHISPKAF